MHTVIDGVERVYGAGDEFDVPTEAVHQEFSNEIRFG
jgi:hypothetical protein